MFKSFYVDNCVANALYKNKLNVLQRKFDFKNLQCDQITIEGSSVSRLLLHWGCDAFKIKVMVG